MVGLGSFRQLIGPGILSFLWKKEYFIGDIVLLLVFGHRCKDIAGRTRPKATCSPLKSLLVS